MRAVMKREVETSDAQARQAQEPVRRTAEAAAIQRVAEAPDAAWGMQSVGEKLATLRSAVVQRLASGGGTEAEVHAAAARGTAGGGGSLPHIGAIQASFGRHDVSSVQAYIGGAAKEASAAMGAVAYATGNKVAFRESPDLHTAAHEAAHVVQQRAGVSLKGGVGQAGDSYEQHADRVADAVVAGQSAEPILDEMAPGGAGGGVQQRAVQREEESTPEDWLLARIELGEALRRYYSDCRDIAKKLEPMFKEGPDLYWYEEAATAVVGFVLELVSKQLADAFGAWVKEKVAKGALTAFLSDLSKEVSGAVGDALVDVVLPESPGHADILNGYIQLATESFAKIEKQVSAVWAGAAGTPHRQGLSASAMQGIASSLTVDRAAVLRELADGWLSLQAQCVLGRTEQGAAAASALLSGPAMVEAGLITRQQLDQYFSSYGLMKIEVLLMGPRMDPVVGLVRGEIARLPASAANLYAGRPVSEIRLPRFFRVRHEDEGSAEQFTMDELGGLAVPSGRESYLGQLFEAWGGAVAGANRLVAMLGGTAYAVMEAEDEIGSSLNLASWLGLSAASGDAEKTRQHALLEEGRARE